MTYKDALESTFIQKLIKLDLLSESYWGLGIKATDTVLINAEGMLWEEDGYFPGDYTKPLRSIKQLRREYALELTGKDD